MSSFTDPLIVRVEQRERHGRGLFTLVNPFTYEVGKRGSGIFIAVQTGFETDFASIPRLAGWLVSPVGIHAKAALIHDALYRRDAFISSGHSDLFLRYRADQIFLDAMEILKVPLWRRWPMYLGVRAFGGMAYRKTGSRE